MRKQLNTQRSSYPETDYVDAYDGDSEMIKQANVKRAMYEQSAKSKPADRSLLDDALARLDDQNTFLRSLVRDLRSGNDIKLGEQLDETHEMDEDVAYGGQIGAVFNQLTTFRYLLDELRNEVERSSRL